MRNGNGMVTAGIAASIVAVISFLVATRTIVFIALYFPILISIVVIGAVFYGVSTNFGREDFDLLTGRGFGGGFVSLSLLVGLVVLTNLNYRDGLVRFYAEPTINSTWPEIKPRATAFEIAQKTLAGEVGNESTTEIGDVDPIYNRETQSIDWFTPKLPSGGFNSITKQVDQIIVLNDEGQTRRINQTFTYGEGMYFFDNVLWQIKWERYLSFVPDNDVFYWELPATTVSPAQMVIVAPLIRYKLNFITPVPVWDGAMVVYPDGRMEHLSVSKAESDPRFEGAQMFPSSLLLKQVGNTCYRFGSLTNCWFTRQHVFEVPGSQTGTNSQPYYTLRQIPNQDVVEYEPVWLVTADPRGEKNQSIVRLFIQSADSREWAIVDMTQNGTLVGSTTALDIVRNRISAYTWVTAQGDGTQIIIEPRPVIQREVYYWLGSITTRDYTETAAWVVVNGDTRQVHTFCSPERIYAWFEGSGTNDAVPCDGGATSTGQNTNLSYESMTEAQLLIEIDRIVQELKRRGLLDD